MAMTLDGSNGVTFNDSSLQGAAASPYGLKNRIINGDMRIDQRYAGTATANTIYGYTVDRWQVIQSVTGKLIAQQNAGSVTPPAGFTNYLGVTSQSAYTIGSGDYYAIGQVIEGYNIADFAWGTANAKTITISFWVRSSLTGTFGGVIQNSANNYDYPFTYTISSANTWEQKTVTIAGPTSGTWLTTNGAGLVMYFGLGVGSTYSGTAGSWQASLLIGATGATSVVGTNGATFYITGVQLEVGSTATPFERRMYGQELALCQRYFIKYGGTYVSELIGVGNGLDTTNVIAHTFLPVTMRTQPSISSATVETADGVNPANSISSTSIRTDISSYKTVTFQGVTTGVASYRPIYVRIANSLSGYMLYSAEL